MFRIRSISRPRVSQPLYQERHFDAAVCGPHFRRREHLLGDVPTPLELLRGNAACSWRRNGGATADGERLRAAGGGGAPPRVLCAHRARVAGRATGPPRRPACPWRGARFRAICTCMRACAAPSRHVPRRRAGAGACRRGAGVVTGRNQRVPTPGRGRVSQRGAVSAPALRRAGAPRLMITPPPLLSMCYDAADVARVRGTDRLRLWPCACWYVRQRSLRRCTLRG